MPDPRPSRKSVLWLAILAFLALSYFVVLGHRPSRAVRPAPPPEAEAPPAEQARFTGWRGGASGFHPDARPPREWTAERNVLWRRDVGAGRSSPVAAADRVFVTAEPDLLLCCEAATGRLLWRRSHGTQDLPDEFLGRDLETPTECGYASPTPCTDGEFVYALFGNGVVAGYDLDGNRRWIRRIDVPQAEEHGRTASPVLAGNRLLVHVTDLFCLDAETGRVLWRQPARPAFGTSVVARVGGDDVVVTPRGDLFRLSDGTRRPSPIAGLDVASPVVLGDIAYFIDSMAMAKRLPGPKSAGPLAALWTVQLPGTFYASPVVHEGRIYAINREGLLVVLDTATGATLHARKIEIDGECSPSLCLSGGALFLGTDKGVTVVLEPGPQPAELARNSLPPGSVATPAFAGDRIFLRSGRNLVCLQPGAFLAAASSAPTPAEAPETRPATAAPVLEAPPGTGKSLLSGWRGNGTGRFPDATPVLAWGRKSGGVVAGLRISARRPAGDAPGGAPAVRHNVLNDWLVAGPFPAAGGLDETPVPDEAGLRPDAGERLGASAWTPCAIPHDVLPPSERDTVAGTVELRFTEPESVLGGFKSNHAVYAHTWLHAERGGEADLVVDHTSGLKAWMNGEEVYKAATSECRIPYYSILSRFRTGEYAVSPSPRMRLRLRAGWNRLLLKAVHGRGNHEGWKFNAIVVDRPGAPAEERNILWAAELPDRSTATPLIVGDRIVVLAEPDQVVCLDKKTGRPLWTRFLGLYQATPEAVRNANPAFREKVEPLVARLPDARGIAERFELRRKIDAALVAIDPGTYKLSWDGHMASHFYIVGWTQPSPCTDGRAVYAYCGNGVAASFDLEGNTRWIRRVNTGELHYPAAPALVDGRFVLFAGGGFNLVALDAATGEVAWRQPAVTRNVGALIGATINGVGVVVTQQGEIVRASDGRLLYGDAKKPAGDTGWAPPCCLGDTVYLPWYGITSLRVMDFAGAAGDAWTCRKRFEIGDIAVSRSRAGKWIDRWSCGSPLIHEGIYYAHDVFGTLYAVDLETRKVLYRQDLSADLDPFTHYNAVGVAASISLGGRHLFVMDNQGTTVVFEPGPVFRKVAVNRLERQIDRPWPVRPQEETGYSPPLFEGSRMYLRGEEFLYCLGRE